MEAAPATDQQSLGTFIRDQRRAAQMSLRELADRAGVSNPYLSQIERGLRRPSAEILRQVARALQVSAEALFVRAGILDHVDEADVVRAVQGTEALTGEQKRVLIRVYEAFVRENADDGPVASVASVAAVADLSGPGEQPGRGVQPTTSAG